MGNAARLKKLVLAYAPAPDLDAKPDGGGITPGYDNNDLDTAEQMLNIAVTSDHNPALQLSALKAFNAIHTAHPTMSVSRENHQKLEALAKNDNDPAVCLVARQCDALIGSAALSQLNLG